MLFFQKSDFASHQEKNRHFSIFDGDSDDSDKGYIFQSCEFPA